MYRRETLEAMHAPASIKAQNFRRPSRQCVTLKENAGAESNNKGRMRIVSVSIAAPRREARAQKPGVKCQMVITVESAHYRRLDRFKFKTGLNV